jgi:hypothetical protein
MIGKIGPLDILVVPHDDFVVPKVDVRRFSQMQIAVCSGVCWCMTPFRPWLDLVVPVELQPKPHAIK